MFFSTTNRSRENVCAGTSEIELMPLFEKFQDIFIFFLPQLKALQR
jgi:hypothetical protein